MSKSPEYAGSPPATSRTRLALLALWSALTLAVLAFAVTLGSNCPNADEWDFVPALLNRAPLAPWLWAQHNEHRLPLPRFIYYVLFQFTHDFRAGAVLQVMLLSGTSLALMSFAARFRGRPHWADAFFPVSLLHVGHWENLLIGYNLCFAFILVLETAIGVIALRTTRENAFRSGCRAGVLMALLCLCGGGGVVTAMPMAAWLVCLAFIVKRRVRSEAGLPDEARIRNPIDPASAPALKLRQLQALTDENKPLIDAFLKQIDAKYGTESRSNVKQPDRIRTKGERPSIRAKKPWHDIEHIRDSFRFKTVLKDLRDLPAIIHELEARLGATILKRDTDKFLTPLQWGWRIVAFDLQMPNGQLVEYYLPVEEIERAKNEGCHELFEKWRNRDNRIFDPETWRQYHADQRASQLAYEAAFTSFVARTGLTDSEVRAILIQAAASASGTAKNSLYISSASKETPATQDLRSSNEEAAKPSESTTMTRPSGAREAIGMGESPDFKVAESRLRANGKSLVLLLLAVFPVLYLVLYLQGYQRPGHHPELGEGGADVLVVAARVMSLAFGPSGSHGWPWMFAVVAVLIGITTAAALRSSANRPSDIGLLAVLAGIVGVAVVIGLGRAGIDPRYGLSSRYGYLVWPLIALPTLFWIRNGGRTGKWIPIALCLVAVLRFNSNMLTGLAQGSRIKSTLDLVQAEAAENVTPAIIVRHFQDTFQAHQEERAIRAIPLLQDARIGLFGEARR